MRCAKNLLFLMVITLVFFESASFVNSGAASISPAKYEDFFEPNMKKSYWFDVSSLSTESSVNISLEGYLVEYATISSDYFDRDGRVIVNLDLPSSIERPGLNSLYVTVTEVRKGSEGGLASVGAISKVRAPIRIFVPYPGKYIEGKLTVENINEEEDVKYSLEINNLGTQGLSISPTIILYKGDNVTDEQIYSKDLDIFSLKSKEKVTLEGIFEDFYPPAGDYFALAIVDYGETKSFSDTFSVGEFLVKIIDYDYQFTTGIINSFNVVIGSEWNSLVDSVYAEVYITDEGKVVDLFKTPSEKLDPWKVKNLTGFFDATNLTAGRYLANIFLHYISGDKSDQNSKLVAVYLYDEEIEIDYLPYVIWTSGAIILLLILFLIYLELKVKKLSGFLKGRYGKKK